MAGILEGRRGLIMGVANERSIAWGIAQAARREGAELAFTYVGEALERRVRPLAASLGSDIVLPCDVQVRRRDRRAVRRARHAVGSLDFLVHSVAFANKDELKGLFLDTSREGFRLALDVSAYSLVACTRAARPLMDREEPS